ncbi:lamin tail domain-containing protein [Thermodesulfobacteriota bacterium]
MIKTDKIRSVGTKYHSKLAIPISLLVTILLLFTFQTANAQNLKIYHIDVEQADATLIISPSGKTLLIDSGKNGHGSRIKAVMQDVGVSRIDYFVCTHYHEDHYGGIDDLANDSEITIGEVYDRGDKDFIPASKRNGKTYKDYQSAVGNRAEQLKRGETIPLDDAMSITCIAHGGVVLHELDPPETGDDENTMSVALFIQYGDFRYFIGGDIEQTTENKIAERDLVLDVDVYQADHHGSDTSSAIEFMEDLKPAVIIISNGNNGTYKHPRQSTLNNYNELDPKPMVFQTNKYLKGGVGGNVADEFIADLETVDEDGTILVSVDETVGTYTVSYRDLSRTFQIKDRGHQSSAVVIESLLPNPDGSDRINEEVMLRNDFGSAVSMTGWILEDESGRIWALVSLGSINPGQSVAIRRSGMPMSLDNDGDEISLFNASHQLVDRFSYSGSQRGVWIQTGH